MATRQPPPAPFARQRPTAVAPPAKCSKTSPKATAGVESTIFEGCSFLLGSMGAASKDVLKKRIIACSGLVAETASSAVTHFAVDRQPDYKTAQLWRSAAPHANLVNVAWIQDCLSHKALIPVARFTQLWPQDPATRAVAALAAPVAAMDAVVAPEQQQFGSCHRCGAVGHWVAGCPLPPGRFKRISRLPLGYACQPHLCREQPAELQLDDNLRLAADFKALAKIYLFLKDCGHDGSDDFRAFAFGKAAKAIKALTFSATENVERTRVELDWKKDSTCHKLLVEWADIETFERLQMFDMYKDDLEIGSVWGIAAAGVCQLKAKGIRSLQMLRDAVKADGAAAQERLGLHDSQMAGLRHHDELQMRIPRAEVKALVDFVAANAAAVASGCEAQGVGSYRRGDSDSGDVDILLTHADEGIAIELLGNLITRLRATGLILATLAISNDDTKKDKKKKESESISGAWSRSCMLIARLPADAALAAGIEGPPRARRIDIKVYPERCMPYALLYFTGSGHFNRSMRRWAKQNLLSLSDKGLVRCWSSKTASPHDGYETSPVVKSEEEIFGHLNLKFVPPHERCV